MNRPEPTWPAPEGCHHVAGIDAYWLVITDGSSDVPGKRCRWTAGSHGRSCKAPAVAVFERGEGNWWAYCADHMYGRWVEDGQVMAWHVEEDEPA